jgi:hypothetical protein
MPTVGQLVELLQGIQVPNSKQIQTQTLRRKNGEGVLFRSDANHAFLGILRCWRGIGELIQDRERSRSVTTVSGNAYGLATLSDPQRETIDTTTSAISTP